MGNIIAIMGKSSSGKDTIFKILQSDDELKLKKVVPYTTRPIRDGETYGVEYFFVDENKFQELKSSGKIIEDRSYNTVMGVWRYFTVNDHQFNNSDDNIIMICTLESYTKLRQYLSNYDFIPVFITIDDGLRLQRALDRERNQINPKYTEMCRRYISDEHDFSDENIKSAGIHKMFVNDDLQRVIEEIKDYIKEIIR